MTTKKWVWRGKLQNTENVKDLLNTFFIYIICKLKFASFLHP